MIRYRLVCDSAHTFESWFRSSGDYEDQRSENLVACPICDSSRVGKALMAPALSRSPTSEANAPPQQTQAAASETSEPERKLRAMVRALHEHIRKNSEDVGPRFADEARSMHYGDIPHRSIYGQASPDEARALLDEGIEVNPLPPRPDDRN